MKSAVMVFCLLLSTLGQANSREYNTITQVSSYNGLLAGLYDSVATYAELEGAGDTGVGTFDRLDGEMVMLDGVLYRIGFDGKITVMPPETPTPYATLVNFNADKTMAIARNAGRDDAAAAMKEALVNPNLPHAVLLKGTFAHIKCRSIPQQSRPYPTLMEIAANQAVFDGNNVKGTIVGFYYPGFAGAFNVPGFHLHFLNDARDFGGHVLDFTVGDDVVALIDECDKLVVRLPNTDDSKVVDMEKDRSADLQKVNRDK